MLVSLLAGFVMSQTPREGHATVELVSSITAAKIGEPFLVGIVIRTDPGWHVYWTNPGDAGTPTSVTWTLPEGWKINDLQWPIPSRFSEGKATTYGYDGSTLLIATVTQPTDAKKGKFSISANVRWTANHEGSSAGAADVRIDRSVNENSYDHPVWHDRLVAASKSLPKPAEGWIVSAGSIKDGYLLKVRPPEPLTPNTSLPTFYCSTPGVLDAGAPQNFRLNDDGTFWMALRSMDGSQPAKRLQGLLLAPKMTTWKNDADAVIVDAEVKP